MLQLYEWIVICLFMIKSASIIWLTGMSGSGKSTLAGYIKDTYQKEGYRVCIIDGDDIHFVWFGYCRNDSQYDAIFTV